MLQALLDRRLGGDVTVAAAGVLPGERPVDETTLQVLGSMGLDAAGHLSRQLGPDAVAKADLILCLERRHVREVAVVDRQALARTFTIRELVRRGERAGPREPGETLELWLARLHAERGQADLLAESPDDDVADPTGGPAAAYAHTARWLDGLAERLVRLAWPPAVLDDDEELESLPATAFATADRPPELEVWRRTDGHHVRPATIGLGADRAGVRLARGVETVLQALGYELYGLRQDAWVAPTWASCASHAADAVARSSVDAVVILTDSGSGPAALANRRAGSRAVAPTDVSAARRARRRWGANLLCLGVDEVTPAEAVEIVQAFLNEPPGSVGDLDDG